MDFIVIRWLGYAFTLDLTASSRRFSVKRFRQHAICSMLLKMWAITLIQWTLAVDSRDESVRTSKRCIFMFNIHEFGPKIAISEQFLLRLDCMLLVLQFASIINDAIDSRFPSSDVRIIAEPGRYYVESAFTFACQVHSIREVRKNGQFSSFMYFINDGVFGSFAIKRYQDVSHPLTLKSAKEKMFTSSVWGPCLSVDDQVAFRLARHNPVLYLSPFKFFDFDFVLVSFRSMKIFYCPNWKLKIF